MIDAYIGIGSNMGDRAAHLAQALVAMTTLDNTRLLRRSPVYETDPVGPIDQPKFLNTAAWLATTLQPVELLGYLRDIERAAGRERDERWGPRTLDLDLLLWGDRIIDSEELTVPHPHMHERWFVLKPLSDIAPEAIHPVLKKTVLELLNQIETPT